MIEKNNQIVFTIIYSGQEYSLKTYWGEYRDLMALITDRVGPDGFGECGGMGRCATCMIEITGLSGAASYRKRNEQATLAKTGADRPNIRLACQVAIDDELSNTTICILE